MKRLKLSCLIMAGLSIGCFYVAAFAATPIDLNSKTYLLEKASHYDQLAKEEDAVIQEHQKLKADIQKLYPPKTQLTPKTMMRQPEPRDTGRIVGQLSGNSLAAAVQDMVLHCDLIIKDAEALKEDYEKTAERYRQRAANLDKK